MNTIDKGKLVSTLETLVEYLPSGKANFADSLINGKYGYYKRPGKFSEKQLHCVADLVKLAEAKKANPAAVVTPEPDENIGTLTGLYNMFKHAKDSGLKFPKLNLEIEGHPVVLKVAGDKSKFPGQINVTDDQPFGVNKWYGRVDVQGDWTRGRGYPETETVLTLLRCLSHDPKATAEQYGKLTGRCCFCNKKLGEGETEASAKSAELGYGPGCAKNWGLKW